MRALEAYRATLRELDKHESPSFTVGDFNWFFNEAIDEYLTRNYEAGDVFQKDLDDISVLIKDDVLLTQQVDKSLFAKPSDYRHLLYLRVRAKALKSFRNFVLNQQYDFTVSRQRTGRRGYQEKNAYDRPSEDNPLYRMSNEKVKVLIGPNFEPVTANLMYIVTPAVVYLNPDPGADFNLEGNNSTLQFSEYVCKELIRWCARIIIENIESRRYETALSEQKMRQE